MKLHKTLTALIILGGVAAGAHAATADLPPAADAGETWRYALVNEISPAFPEPAEGDRVAVHVAREDEAGEFREETQETTTEGFQSNVKRVEGDAVSALVVPEVIE